MTSPRTQPPRAGAAADSPTTGTEALSNQSVAMSVRILDEFTRAGHSLGVSELARLLGESKARVHRHLSTLKGLGLVSQEALTERYGLGWKIFQWGAALGQEFGIRRIADEHLSELRDATHHTAAFAIPAQGDALVLTSVESENRITIQIKRGVIVSAAASALGRVVLAFSSPAVRERVLARPLHPKTAGTLTAETITNAAQMEQRLELIRERFYEIAVNENVYGISMLAAPVFDQSEEIAGALGIVGSPYTLPTEPPPAMLRAVQDAAQRMSASLGSNRWSEHATQASVT